MHTKFHRLTLLAIVAVGLSACQLFENAVGGLRNIVDENEDQPRFGYGTGPQAPIVGMAVVTEDNAGLILASDPLGISRGEVFRLALSPDNTLVGGSWVSGEPLAERSGVFALDQSGDLVVRESLGTITLDGELACRNSEVIAEARAAAVTYVEGRFGASAAADGNLNVIPRRADDIGDFVVFTGWLTDNSFAMRLGVKIAVRIELEAEGMAVELPSDRQPLLSVMGRYAPGPRGGWLFDACASITLEGAPERAPVRDMRVRDDGEILLDDRVLEASLLPGSPMEPRDVVLLDGPY